MRYWRLFLHFLQFSFSRAMEFRLDFFFRILMDLIFYIVQITFYKILFLHTPFLGGWNDQQILIFVGSYLLLDAVYMTLFTNNMWWLPVFVNKGELDYYLIRPVSSLFFLSFRDFAANSFINLIMALGILGVAIFNYLTSLPSIDPFVFGMRFFLYILALTNGLFLYYALRLFFILTVFWTHSSRGADQIFWGLTPCFERPDQIYRGWVRVLLTTILPYILMASFPARIFIEGLSLPILINITLVSFFFAFTLRFVWDKALRSYSSASS